MRRTLLMPATAVLAAALMAGGCDDGSEESITCSNWMRDGQETDVDCGGICSPCQDGQNCVINEDCLSGNCDGRICRAAGISCSDGELNGNESDVDCGGGCDPCGGGETCNDGDDCDSGLCSVDGTCQEPTCDDGAVNGSETDIDCGGEDCEACTEGQSCDDDSDCYSLSCTNDTCEGVYCDDGELNGRETDIDCGGLDCTPCVDGQSCLVPRDCHSEVCEVAASGEGICRLATCDDGVQNENETGVDCGGPDCGLCSSGQGCASASDCESGVCNGSICADPRCDDGVRNQNETDVDCGGPEDEGCPRCAVGDECGVWEDCVSGYCSTDAEPPVCAAPSCSDGVQNGDEGDVDCGGSSPLCDRCTNGDSCSLPGDCTSGVCQDSTCVAATCVDDVLNGSETDLDCGGEECSPCADGASCHNAGDCVSEVCEDRTCQTPTCDDSVVNGDETDEDCGGPDCAPCGDERICEEDGDCQSLVCTGGECQASLCTDEVQNGEETDEDCGGGRCSPCADGLGCAVETDCVSSVCIDELCASPTCEDGAQNQSETDVDCGGSDADGCPLCDDGDHCLEWDDCLSGYCSADSDPPVCAAPSCTDGVHNGDEGDLDCGGSDMSCERCENGATCLLPRDCVSDVCDGGRCVAGSCTDGVENGFETDVDCGGEDCAECEAGQGCGIGDDCVSGVCDEETCQEPTCLDEVHNGGETDMDCGGLDCDPCEDWASCTDAEDCQSLVCYRETCQSPLCDDGVENGDETDMDCGGDTGCGRCLVGEGCLLSSDCESAAYCVDSVCVRASSCLDLHTQRPETISGSYMIDPDGDDLGSHDPCTVWCDMTTEGGGWTMVGSSRGSSGTFDDKASVCYADLGRDRPNSAHPGVWEGMRAFLGTTSTHSDIRFSCRSHHEDAAYEVDMVFWDNDWYWEITIGTDSHSCFNVEGSSPAAPARTNLIDGTYVSETAGWSTPMESEWSCEDLDSFAVDFDGPGLGHRVPVNATSWGEAWVQRYNESREEWEWVIERRCGPVLPVDAASWFVWVREIP